MHSEISSVSGKKKRKYPLAFKTQASFTLFSTFLGYLEKEESFDVGC